MCLAGMDRHRPTGLTAQTVATARGKPRIPQIVGGMGAYGNTHHICSNLCNLRFPRAVRAVVASLPPNFHGLHCCNGVRGKREEAQRRGKKEKGIGGWWGSAPRPRQGEVRPAPPARPADVPDWDAPSGAGDSGGRRDSGGCAPALPKFVSQSGSPACGSTPLICSQSAKSAVPLHRVALCPPNFPGHLCAAAPKDPPGKP